MKVKVLETGEVVDVEFARHPQIGDKGVIRYPNGKSTKCEVCMAPINREPAPDEVPIGVFVQVIE